MQIENTKIAILGLGYVGLPLAVAFSKHFPTIGFDIKTGRVEDLKKAKIVHVKSVRLSWPLPRTLLSVVTRKI